MSARAKRWAWTAAWASMPFILVAFSNLSLDITEWGKEARFAVAAFSAFFGFGAATFPYQERRA